MSSNKSSRETIIAARLSLAIAQDYANGSPEKVALDEDDGSIFTIKYTDGSQYQVTVRELFSPRRLIMKDVHNMNKITIKDIVHDKTVRARLGKLLDHLEELVTEPVKQGLFETTIGFNTYHNGNLVPLLGDYYRDQVSKQPHLCLTSEMINEIVSDIMDATGFHIIMSPDVSMLTFQLAISWI